MRATEYVHSEHLIDRLLDQWTYSRERMYLSPDSPVFNIMPA